MVDADEAVWAYVRRVLENPALIVEEMERQWAAQGTTDVERDLETIAEQLGKLASRERKLLALASIATMTKAPCSFSANGGPSKSSVTA